MVLCYTILHSIQIQDGYAMVLANNLNKGMQVTLYVVSERRWLSGAWKHWRGRGPQEKRNKWSISTPPQILSSIPQIQTNPILLRPPKGHSTGPSHRAHGQKQMEGGGDDSQLIPSPVFVLRSPMRINVDIRAFCIPVAMTLQQLVSK